MLERLEPGEIGAERHHAEVGLVAEHREQQRLVAVGLTSDCTASSDALARLRVGLRAGAVDAVEEVEHAPPDRRLDRRPSAPRIARGSIGADHRGDVD